MKKTIMFLMSIFSLVIFTACGAGGNASKLHQDLANSINQSQNQTAQTNLYGKVYIDENQSGYINMSIDANNASYSSKIDNELEMSIWLENGQAVFYQKQEGFYGDFYTVPKEEMPFLENPFGILPNIDFVKDLTKKGSTFSFETKLENISTGLFEILGGFSSQNINVEVTVDSNGKIKKLSFTTSYNFDQVETAFKVVYDVDYEVKKIEIPTILVDQVENLRIHRVLLNAEKKLSSGQGLKVFATSELENLSLSFSTHIDLESRIASVEKNIDGIIEREYYLNGKKYFNLDNIDMFEHIEWILYDDLGEPKIIPENFYNLENYEANENVYTFSISKSRIDQSLYNFYILNFLPEDNEIISAHFVATIEDDFLSQIKISLTLNNNFVVEYNLEYNWDELVEINLPDLSKHIDVEKEVAKLFYEEKKDGTIKIIGMKDKETNIVVVPKLIEDKLVTEIEGFGSDKLEKVSIPTSVTTLGKMALSNSLVEEVYLSKNIINIDVDAFSFMPKLKQFFVDEENPYYTTYNGSLISRNGDFIQYTLGALKEIFTIPYYIKTIKTNAFSEAFKLREIFFEQHSQLERIEKTAFFITEIKKIELPYGLKVIESNAFYGSWLLSELFIPDSVEEFERGAFFGLNLKKVTIPFLGDKRYFEYFEDNFNYGYGFLFDNKESEPIEEFLLTDTETLMMGAFGNASIKKLTFSDKLKTIQYLSFVSNNIIEELILPNTVEIIEWAGINDLLKTKKLTIPFLGKTKYEEYDENGINTRTLQYMMGNTYGHFEEVTIAVENDYKYNLFTSAFQGFKIKTLNLNGIVENVGDYAFRYMDETEKINFQNDNIIFKGKSLDGLSENVLEKDGDLNYFNNWLVSIDFRELDPDFDVENKGPGMTSITLRSGTIGIYHDALNWFAHYYPDGQIIYLNKELKYISGKFIHGTHELRGLENTKLEYIGDYALGGLYNDKIVLPSTLKEIGEHIFHHNNLVYFSSSKPPKIAPGFMFQEVYVPAYAYNLYINEFKNIFPEYLHNSLIDRVKYY